MREQLHRFMPITGVLQNYNRAMLKGDAAAGMTTAVMLIPQGMAYAMLAGLPPIHGLYASIIPLALYALFGTSRELAVGPVAMVSLLVATGVGSVAEGSAELFIAYAVLLSLMVGVMQLVMGLGRLGFLVNFLSHPVISGFTSAAAIIIGLSQLKHLLGVKLGGDQKVHALLYEALTRLGEVKPLTLGLGLGAMALLMGLKRWNPKFPAALVAVVLGTLAVYFGGLHEHGVAIVGSIPAGFPAPSLPVLDVDAMRGLLPIAITISMVGFMESISVAKSFANRNKYEVNANQELVALGAANLGGALFQAYPVTGGFSRTAVNAAAGAKSTVASLITAGVIALALMFFTPLFYYLPQAVLAAIIMVAVFGLVDIKEVKHLWQVKRSDLAMLVITFVGTLSFGIEEGILLGAGASLLWFIVKTTRPHFAVLGRVPGTTAYRNVRNYPEAERISGVLMVRMDAQFYFGNVSFLKEQLKELEAEAQSPLHTVILDASAMNQLDSSAASALEELAQSYAARDINLLLANVKRPILDVLERAHYIERYGKDTIFLAVHDAVLSVSANPLKPSRSHRCEPLLAA